MPSVRFSTDRIYSPTATTTSRCLNRWISKRRIPMSTTKRNYKQETETNYMPSASWHIEWPHELSLIRVEHCWESFIGRHSIFTMCNTFFFYLLLIRQISMELESEEGEIDQQISALHHYPLDMCVVSLRMYVCVCTCALYMCASVRVCYIDLTW